MAGLLSYIVLLWKKNTVANLTNVIAQLLIPVVDYQLPFRGQCDTAKVKRCSFTVSGMFSPSSSSLLHSHLCLCLLKLEMYILDKPKYPRLQKEAALTQRKMAQF